MGFSLPKLEIPKLSLPDLNAELNKLTKTFDPSAMVGQVAGNIQSQQASIEAVRANLESIRQSAQKAMANVDFNALKDYTTGLAGQVDTACVMASVKPAYVPMTPDSLSNPLAADVLGSITGELTGEELGDMLIANTGNLVAVAEAAGFAPSGSKGILDNVVSGNLSEIASSDNITDLAIMGAGMYVSGATGGVIPPSVASTVIENVAGNVVGEAVAGAMSGDPQAMLDAAAQINPNIDMDALSGAIAADYTGGMSEGIINNTVNHIFDKISDDNISRVDNQSIALMGQTVLRTLNPEGYTGTVGGINYGDPTAITQGMTLNALYKAADAGDVDSIITHAHSLIQQQVATPQQVQPVIDAAATNVTQTPQNIESFQSLFNEFTSATTPPTISDDSVQGKEYDPKQMADMSLYEQKEQLSSAFANRDTDPLIIIESGSIKSKYFTIDTDSNTVTVRLDEHSEATEYGAIEFEDDIQKKYPSIAKYGFYINTVDNDTHYRTMLVDAGRNDICYVTFTCGDELMDGENAPLLCRDITKIVAIDLQDRPTSINNKPGTSLFSGIAKAGGRLAEVINGTDSARKGLALQPIITQARNTPTTYAAMGLSAAMA